MSSPRDPHDPRFDLDRQDSLALLALGESVPGEFVAHQDGCPQCQRELAALNATVALARESGPHRRRTDVDVPPGVWSAITAELGLAGPPVTAVRSVRRPDPRRRVLLAAAAVVLIALGGVGGYLAGHTGSGSRPAAVSPATLSQFPGGPIGVSGTATVHRTADGIQLTINTAGLPARPGYYEVWLFDPTVNNMVAIGALGNQGNGTYTLPADIDLHGYDTVDVSAQDYKGGAVITHAQSVLRGTFTQ